MILKCSASESDSVEPQAAQTDDIRFRRRLGEGVEEAVYIPSASESVKKEMYR